MICAQNSKKTAKKLFFLLIFVYCVFYNGWNVVCVLYQKCVYSKLFCRQKIRLFTVAKNKSILWLTLLFCQNILIVVFFCFVKFQKFVAYNLPKPLWLYIKNFHIIFQVTIRRIAYNIHSIFFAKLFYVCTVYHLRKIYHKQMTVVLLPPPKIVRRGIITFVFSVIKSFNLSLSCPKLL